MKKKIYLLFAAVTMLLAVTSCSQEEDFAQQSSNGVTSFSISLNDATQSRALGEGYEVDKLYYAVYQDGEKVYPKNGNGEFDITEKKVKFDLPLLKGEEYDIIFWAQNSESQVYDISNLTEIKVKYEKAKSNQDSYDAFYNALVGFKADGNNHKVKLTRPFAQVNLGTNDWKQVLDFLPVKTDPVTKTSVTVTGLADTFAPLTGVASVQNTSEATFEYNALPKKNNNEVETFIIDHNKNNQVEKGETYTYLSSNYFLIPSQLNDESATIDLTFKLSRTLADNNTDKELQTINVPNVPVKRNYRTNIIGALLTGTNFDIILDAGFSDKKQYDFVDIVGWGALNDALSDNKSKNPVAYNVSGLKEVDLDEVIEIVIPSTFVSENVLFSFNDIKDRAKLSITNAAGADYSKTVCVNLPNLTEPGKALGSTTVTLPKAHVELLIGNFGNTSASTSKTTLVVGTNATIGELVVAQGNVNIYGAVNAINVQGGSEETIIVTLGEKSKVTTIDDKIIVRTDVTPEEDNTVYVAKVGEYYYKTLAGAVKVVEDGGTITLIANETFTGENRTLNSGTYYDGLYYIGDKSFTIDLKDKTIGQDGAVNDYLLNFKNDGAKENTITLKNGTIDAGTVAYCAVATSSSNAQKITINLENINLIGNNSGGAVLKIRGGTELNVNAGTVITGKNNYVGIEAVGNNTVVNIYDGAKIYQNGTSSYVGAIVGASYNATMNIYGGKGQSAKCGIIVMSTGATINVSGGEWIANNDDTVAGGNQGVLVSQNNRYESGWACKSVMNVTGGTFKGGYDCWGSGPGQEPDDAQINIKGGNFNADPTSYLVEGFKIQEGTEYNVVVDPVAKIGNTEYDTLEEAFEAAQAGSIVTVLRNVTLTEQLELPAGITFNGNGKQINGTIYAGGDLTFAGHTKVTLFSASFYNRTITIGEGACLEVTGTGRVTLGYGNTFNITGTIEDAKTADKTTIQPSLIIPGGISITGGNNAAFNVTNAYVQIGKTSSKNSAANGKFTLNFDNSIAEFTNQFTLSEPTGGNNPTFNMNIENSVFTTSAKLCVAAPNSNVVIDNSTVTLGSNIRNSGKFTLKNGSVLTGSTIQFGENGGNDGTITVDNSTLTIDASSTGHAFDGKGVGSIVLKNGANASVAYYKAMTITKDETSNFTGEEVK